MAATMKPIEKFHIGQLSVIQNIVRNIRRWKVCVVRQVRLTAVRQLCNVA
jgi:hypothetical protein